MDVESITDIKKNCTLFQLFIPHLYDLEQYAQTNWHGKFRACIYKRFWRPGIDSEESIPAGWESIPGLLKRPTNTGSGSDILINHLFLPAL